MAVDINAVVSKYEAAKKVMIEECRVAFRDLTQQFFDANPDITSFGWTQYTPYFADGDECEFGVGEFFPSNLPIEDIHENFYEIVNGYADEIESDAFYEFLKQIVRIPDEVYKDVFGDHVAVVALNNGDILTKEYDHE